MKNKDLFSQMIVLNIKQYMKSNNQNTLGDFLVDNNFSPMKLAMLPYFFCGASENPKENFNQMGDWALIRIYPETEKAFCLSICPYGILEVLNEFFHKKNKTDNLFYKDNMFKLSDYADLSLEIDTKVLSIFERLSFLTTSEFSDFDENTLHSLMRKSSIYSVYSLLRASKKCDCGKNVIDKNFIDTPLNIKYLIQAKHVFSIDPEKQILI
jgi:hypothetical protein